MRTSSIPPRLRTPAIMAAGGAVVLAVSGAVHGWPSVVVTLPVLLLAVVGYYVWGGRDTDTAALLRHQADERQAELRLRSQALVGRVMSAAAAVAYLIAIVVKAPLWPFAIAVALPAATLVAAWLRYREQDAS